MANVKVDKRKVVGASVAWITVERPEKLNSLNSDMIAKLTAAAASLLDDPEPCAVVLTGAGERAFIGGADVAEMAELTPRNAAKFIMGLHGASAALRVLPIPVIARIRGFCLGGGMEIAAACDIRIASDDSTFGMPEVSLGLPSVIEAAIFPRLIGEGRANWLLLTGETLDAKKAYEWGFLEDVVPAAKLDAAVERTLATIIRNGPEAVRAQKELMRRWDALPLDEAILSSVPDFVHAYNVGEPQRMMKKFLERKKKKKG
ncbi:MAG: enoyl-CoA hydratase/isomerase family protein [Rhodospirillales bacterium]|nr:enoyl-CoA hydratase/isomerase family protein [Rhodospirillales bacterium]